MKGGMCPIHGCELNGFGSLVFCNQCDREMEETTTPVNSDSEDTWPGVGKVKEPGYIVRPSLITSGEIYLESVECIYLKKPVLQNGFVYEIDLSAIEYTITGNGKNVYPNDDYIGVKVTLC